MALRAVSATMPCGVGRAAPPRSLCIALASRCAAALGLAWACSAAPAQGVSAQMSPVVTFDPDRVHGRPPTARALSAAELKLARERAEALYELLKASPSFSQPRERSTLATSWAVVTPQGALEQEFTVYWSAPRDVRQRADTALWPVLGGAHRMLYFSTNRVPDASKLEDRATRGNFSRSVAAHGVPRDTFAQPRVLGELGGGTVFADMIVFTRDARNLLEPTPLGPLLEAEVQRLGKLVAQMEAGVAASLRELEASMTPQAIATRRAKREALWQAETRDPAALARRLDAAERSDDADHARQKERLTAPATRDPKSTWWGPRLALAAAEATLAAASTAARDGPACGRIDNAFAVDNAVRFVSAAVAPRDCVPMVQVRADAVDARRLTGEVQLLTVWSRESLCGVPLAGGAPPQRGLCEDALPLLQEIDWAALRRALGW
jgi:hypothetical protein